MELFINRDVPGDDAEAMPRLLPVMAFVPVQTELETFENCGGFERGTLFTCLYKPFKAGEKA